MRDDIADAPSRIARGTVQWDASLGLSGGYRMSVGDDTVIKALADGFGGANGFDVAGGLTAVDATFSQYAASIVSESAIIAD